MDFYVNSFLYFNNFVVWKESLHHVDEDSSKQSRICDQTNIRFDDQIKHQSNEEQFEKVKNKKSPS